MTWSDTPIVGSNSVSANKAPINNAFSYIAQEMVKDHFWDDNDSDKDGRHNIVHMPEQTGDPSSMPVDMKGGYYVRQKTAGESPAKQLYEPYYFNEDGATKNILQLGFRAMVQFDGRSSNGACTINYSHNISGVSRTGTGLYTVTFTTALPSSDYIPLAFAMRNASASTASLYVSADNAASKTTSIGTSSLKIRFSSGSGGDVRDPLVGTIAIMGG